MWEGLQSWDAVSEEHSLPAVEGPPKCRGISELNHLSAILSLALSSQDPGSPLPESVEPLSDCRATTDDLLRYLGNHAPDLQNSKGIETSVPVGTHPAHQ